MEPIDTTTLRRIAEAIGLAARIFEREADENLLERVRAYDADPLTGLPEDAQKLADRSKRHFEKALADREQADNKKLWDDYLDAAYAELFLGVSKDPIAPFESVYTSVEKTLYGKQYFAIADLMSEVGFDKPANFEEPEDHLAIELALYAKLVLDACEAAKSGNSEKTTEQLAYAQVLKEDHLDKWVAKACDDLISRDDSHGFYSGAAYLVKAALITLP